MKFVLVTPTLSSAFQRGISGRYYPMNAFDRSRRHTTKLTLPLLGASREEPSREEESESSNDEASSPSFCPALAWLGCCCQGGMDMRTSLPDSSISALSLRDRDHAVNLRYVAFRLLFQHL